MAKVTFEVPPELKSQMDSHPEVNWSEVLRQAVARHIEVTRIAREIEREMSDPRVQAVAAHLKKAVAERYRNDVREKRDQDAAQTLGEDR